MFLGHVLFLKGSMFAPVPMGHTEETVTHVSPFSLDPTVHEYLCQAECADPVGAGSPDVTP